MNESELQSRQLVSTPAYLKSLSSDLSKLLECQSLDKQAVFESRSAGCLILQRLYNQLKFDAKFNYIKKCSDFQCDLAKIANDLILLRILNLASKHRSSIKVDFFEINVEKFSNFRWFFSKP